MTVDEGINEAKFVIEHLKGKCLEYPIYVEVQDTYYQEKTTKINLTDVVKSFCETLENNNYYVGIYTSLDWFNNKLDSIALEKYDKWIAQSSNINTFNTKYTMWRFSSQEKIGGLININLNCCYKNFPFIIVTKGLNGYTQLLKNNNKTKKTTLIFKKINYIKNI